MRKTRYQLRGLHLPALDKRKKIALVLLGGAGVVFLLSRSKTVTSAASGLVLKAVNAGQEVAFAAALPFQLARWAPNILTAADRYGVSPWMLAGIMMRESLGGAALTPANDPRGTGDFIPRPPSSAYFKYANPATGLPPDGKGWGRGLMQIDYGVHNTWATSNDWGNPQVNIDKAASILAEHMNFFRAPNAGKTIYVDAWRILTGIPRNNTLPWRTKYPSANIPAVPAGASKIGPFNDVRPLSGIALQAAAFAAYNAGPSGVLQALVLGLPAEAATTGQDYVSWLATKMQAWLKNF